MQSDTVAALATPVGTSAVALIRVSGPMAKTLANDLSKKVLAPRQATYSKYRNSAGEVLDSVLMTYFPGPNSYTGEDSLEVTCHGNPFIAHQILHDLHRRGCRPAEPGEFTRRAFLNGKMDLSQAEAVIDIIHARSERALRAAHQQLHGSLRRHIEGLIEQYLAALARLEAYVDFPEEDLPEEDKVELLGRVEAIAQGVNRLLATQQYGEILRQGIRMVIIGEPNAGKSSLLNRLLGSDRALVSPEAGTTRDFIEEQVMMGPHCIRIIDTAGLNPSPAPLEKLGMEKTLERAETADLHLFLLDATRPVPTFPPALHQAWTNPTSLIVANKSDLRSDIRLAIADERVTYISALTGEGIPELTAKIIEIADSFSTQQGDEAIAINARHALALTRAREATSGALTGLEKGLPVELVSADLRAGMEAIGEITGRIDNERMLDHLFSTFCIGK